MSMAMHGHEGRSFLIRVYISMASFVAHLQSIHMSPAITATIFQLRHYCQTAPTTHVSCNSLYKASSLSSLARKTYERRLNTTMP